MNLTITANLKVKGELPKSFQKDLAKSIKETLPDDIANISDADVKVSKIAVSIE